MRNLIRKILKEDFDWTDSTQPETEWDKDKYYVLDVTSLSGLKLRETIDDIWDFAYNIDYDVEIGVTYDSVGYIYFEPTDEVPEGYALDWSNRGTEDPTFGGKYQMLSLEEFYHMAYGDEPSINESFEWVEEVPSLPLDKDDHWFIFVNSLEEQREAEDYIHSRGYTIYGPEYEDYCFYKDQDPNPLSALEHDPEEGRTLDNLYDGRYLSYEQAKEEYPDAKIYVWSKVKGVVNESLDWVGDVNPLKHGYYYIDARDLSREERIELQKKLLNLGFRWGDSSSDGPDQINLWALNTLQGYTIDGSKNRIYYSIEPYDGVSRRWLKYLSYDEFLELIVPPEGIEPSPYRP